METRRFRAALADAGRWGAAILGALAVGYLLSGCAHKGPLFDIDTRQHPPAAASAAPVEPAGVAVLVQVVDESGRSITAQSLTALNAATGLRDAFEMSGVGTSMRIVDGDGTLTDWRLAGEPIRCSKTATPKGVNYLCIGSFR